MANDHVVGFSLPTSEPTGTHLPGPLGLKDEPYRDFIRRKIDDLQKQDYSLSGMIDRSISLGLS